MPVGQADRAGVDDAPGVGEPVEGHMGVPDDHGSRGHSGERGVVVGARAVHGDELVVVARGGVAERHRPRPSMSRVTLSGSLASRSRWAGRSWPRTSRSGRRADSLGGPLGWKVPSNASASQRSLFPYPDRPLAEFLQAVKGLGGHGPVGEIPPSTTASTPAASTSRRTASSAGRLPMDVGQHRDPHDRLPAPVLPSLPEPDGSSGRVRPQLSAWAVSAGGSPGWLESSLMGEAVMDEQHGAGVTGGPGRTGARPGPGRHAS